MTEGHHPGRSIADVPRGFPVVNFLAGDPLRGLAAVWVVLLHCAAVTLFVSQRSGLYQQSFGRWLGALLGSGGAGLDIFFVLSGYLISRPFVHAVADDAAWPRLPRYALARVLRIYPAFWCAVIVAVVINGTKGIRPWQMIQFVTLRHVSGSIPLEGVLAPAWSLPLELGFYVVVPVVAAGFMMLRRTPRLPQPGRMAVIVVALVAFVAAELRMALASDTSTVLFATLGFAPGVLIAATEARAPAWLLTRAAGRCWLILAGVSCAALAVHIDYLPALGRWGSLLPPLLATGIVGGLLMYQRATGTCPAAVDNRVTRWIGERSYGIYIFHYLILTSIWKWAYRAEAWHLTMLRLTLATLPLVVAVADLSWRWVERPALSLRARMTRTGRPSAETTTVSNGSPEPILTPGARASALEPTAGTVATKSPVT